MVNLINQSKTCVIGAYVHNTLANNIGTRACLVSLEGVNSSDASKLLADNIALQILGMKPDYITKENIPADVLQKEMDKIKADFGDSLKGKPAAVAEKMIEGKMKRFYEDNVLYDQPLLTDQEKEPKTIGQLINEQSKAQGTNIKIKEYLLWTCK